MDYIDLRSDTVTWPTPQMREAMANARVGDDVFGDDPTVKQLEAESAELLGKEAGVFVASGTMGNLTAMLTHCERGSEIIMGKRAHTYTSEVGGAAAIGGIQPNPLDVQPDGTLRLDDIRAAIRVNDEHYPRTRLIVLENTQAASGGNPLTAQYTQAVANIAHEHGLKLHIDGARLFNAAAALSVPANELVADADSVSFCLSKGLCAPVGSVLVGAQAFITEARRARKILGGSMRQVGILAAAGLVAIHEMIDRLADDHANACLLAEGLATIPGLRVEVERVRTNFVFFDLLPEARLSSAEFCERLAKDYRIVIRPLRTNPNRFRLVTHYWITSERVGHVIEAVNSLLS